MPDLDQLEPSHDLALAIAIIMQETPCEAAVAAGWIHQRATAQSRGVLDVAADIVAAGTAIVPVDPHAPPVALPRTFADLSAAIAIVMHENACDAHAAARLIRERARALGVGLDEVAPTIVEIGSGRDEGPDNLRDWLSR